MNDCGPTLWATRSRRCINSATRSFSSNVGAGGVILMFEGMLVPRTARPAGLTTAKATKRASSAKITRVVFNFIDFSSYWVGSVPPRGSGWVLLTTHPLPRGGTNPTQDHLEYNELASDAEEIHYGDGAGIGAARGRVRGRGG